MAKEFWVVSDTHFGHANILNFRNPDGSKVRPHTSVEEMDEQMIQRWNEVVGVNDRVYHLGDVAINRRYLPTLNRLNGKKVLIKGNHDIFKLPDYTPYFEDIRAYQVWEKMIFSHIPLSIDSIDRFKFNVHGHTHTNFMMHPQYLCVCVEHTDFRPISASELRKRTAAQAEKYAYLAKQKEVKWDYKKF
jgi:calcineurin-like phosphoesterase family protein